MKYDKCLQEEGNEQQQQQQQQQQGNSARCKNNRSFGPLCTQSQSAEPVHLSG